jgi:transposase
MRPISIDLRKRVIAAYEGQDQSMGQIAERFAMPKGTVQNIIEHYRATGSVAPTPQNPGRKPAFQGKALARLEADVDRHPDATLEELRDRSGVRVSVVAVHNTLKKLGFTLKKSLYVRMSSADPT